MENFHDKPESTRSYQPQEPAPEADQHRKPTSTGSEDESSDSLYLKQLQFRPKDGKTFLNFFINNFRITVLIVIGLLLWGLFSLAMLPLESTPEVKIPYGVVSVSIPGASPEDIEELVVKKLETRLANLSGVKQIRASALNSYATVTVEFRAEEDLKDAIRRLRDAVSQAKADLPAEASEPSVMEISFSNIPVWTIVVSGPYDSFSLRKYAEMVQDELKKLPGASEVNISGGDVYQARVSYDPIKLATFGLTPDTVSSIIKANNFAIPSGTVKVSNFNYSVRVDGKLGNVSSLREMGILTLGSGQIIKLKDVADVVEMAQERQIFNTFSDAGKEPVNAITLNIVKKTGSSIIDLIDSGKVAIEKLKQERLPQNINISTTLDTSKYIRRNIDQLVHDGLLTIMLVTLLLFLFVGLKEAFVAGLAVPLVFCASFGMMYLFGLTINFLSLFSLILSLGMLVDDAIVVVQATKQYLATGKFTPEEAVLLVFRDYKVLLTTTTATTIWAFLPLLLASGIIGQFIRSIPITVSITLAASFIIAIIINHPMAIILERFRMVRAIPQAILGVLAAICIILIVTLFNGSVPAYVGIPLLVIFAAAFFALLIAYRTFLKEKLKRNEELMIEELADPAKIKDKIYHHYLAPDHEKSFFARAISGIVKMDKILPYYGRLLASILKSKTRQYIILAVIALLFIGAVCLPAGGFLKSEFLPPSDAEYLYINIEGAAGLAKEKTKEIALKVQDIVLKEQAISSFSLIIGNAGVNNSSRLNSVSSLGESNKAQLAINLYPYKQRPVSAAVNKVEKSYELAQRLRPIISRIEGAKIEVQEAASGPPSGSDFEVRIYGDDIKELEKIANRYKEIAAAIPGTINEKTSISLSPGEFTFSLDYDKMSQKGVTSAQVASVIRTAVSGSDVAKILQNGDELQIRSEYKESSVDTIDKIRNLQMVNSRGQIFLLSEIADIKIGSSLNSISRIDQKRVVSVTAGVEKPYLPSEVLKQFQEQVKNEKLPQGYEVAYGGQTETNTESIYSILRAMIVAAILIVATLVLQFNSFRKAVLAISTIPLAVTGVFYGLTLFGLTLSFPSLIGLVALFGIVVKNAIILVDKVNLNLKVGIPYHDAIIDAAKSRLEAIFLTSICTIIGMIPITFTDETWTGLGATMIFGLSTSTFLTLLIIPILYNLLMKKVNDKDQKLKQLKAHVAATSSSSASRA